MTFVRFSDRRATAAPKANSRIYRYEPVLMDATDRRTGLTQGDLVIKCQPAGTPSEGTMGQCYVADLDGTFIGMVCVNSLKQTKHTLATWNRQP